MSMLLAIIEALRSTRIGPRGRYGSVVWLSLLLHVCPSAWAKDIEGFTVPDQIRIDGRLLRLSGVAARTVSLLRVRVWVSALYLQQHEVDYQRILTSDQYKLIDLFPTYNASQADSRQGWKTEIEENCDKQCEPLRPELDRFLATVPEFRKGDSHRYIFSPDGLQCLLNGKTIYASNNRSLATLILSTWIGKHPPSEAVRNSLLGVE